MDQQFPPDVMTTSIDMLPARSVRTARQTAEEALAQQAMAQAARSAPEPQIAAAAGH